MGYQIAYGAALVKTHIPERRKIRISIKSAGIFFAVFLILIVFFLGSREAVQDFLLPGNSQITKAALSKLVTELQEGEPLSASFDAFCREIVDGANIPK